MKRLPKEDRAGLHITIIVHLVVLIILLLAGISREISKENSFILDFSKAEEVEKLQKELALKEAIAQRLEQMINEGGSTPVRNIAVDRSGQLKDDRNTDAEQLYKDAERLQRELNKGQNRIQEDEVSVAAPEKEQEEKEMKYSGPSVLSWELEGRKASRLPIPAYRCMGAGEVKVKVGVDPSGNVVSASISDAESSKDGCLRSFAIRAARLSRFSASQSAPPKQQGWIIYQFIAQ